MASALELMRERTELLAHIEEINAELASIGAKRCTRCKEIKSSDEFYRQARNKDGLHSWCKQCVKEYGSKRYADDPEAYHQYYMKRSEEQKERYAQQRAMHDEENKKRKAQWRTDNPDYHRQYRIDNADKYRVHTANRKALSMAAGGTFTTEQFTELCEQYDNRCLCCGEAKKLTVDHVIPLGEGGSNDISNIQPLCQSCNSKKGTKTIDYRNIK